MHAPEAIVTDLEAPLLTFQTYFLMGDLQWSRAIERPPTILFSARVRGWKLSEAACVAGAEDLFRQGPARSVRTVVTFA